jgi:hypothetical protein
MCSLYSLTKGQAAIGGPENSEMANEPHFSIPSLSEHAMAIGHVCILWAWVENAIELFLSDLAFNGDEKAGKGVLANLEMREKGHILKEVALAKKPTDRWYEGVRDIVDDIDNELRPKRNRFVHDLWWLSGETVEKRWKRAKIKRAQARHASAPPTHEDAPVDAAEIWELADLMVHVMIELGALHHEYLDGTGRAAATRRPTQPQMPRTRFGRRK